MGYEYYLLLIAQGLFAIFVIIGYAILHREVKKGNKDQQEIKTRLHWVKERQKEILEILE